MFAGSLLAQEGGRVYEACAPDEGKIRARALPGVVDQDRCPVAGRVIVDGGVGAVVPEPGMAITAVADTPEGGQHLTVSNPRGDEILLEDAGKEKADDSPPDALLRFVKPACLLEHPSRNRPGIVAIASRGTSRETAGAPGAGWGAGWSRVTVAPLSGRRGHQASTPPPQTRVPRC